MKWISRGRERKKERKKKRKRRMHLLFFMKRLILVQE